MRETRIGNRYAKALFNLAEEQHILDPVREDIGLLEKVLSESREFKMMLKSPVINPDKKIQVIRALFENKIGNLTFQFLILITKKRREAYLGPIVFEFIKLYKEFRNIITTYLQTATKIDDKTRNEIIGLITKQSGGEVELIESVKPILIGGFLLKYNDYQYDATIARQISDLRKEFKVNLYQRKI